MEPMTPLYLSSLLISFAVFVYSYIDGKRSDENLETFLDEVLKDELADAKKEIQQLRAELELVKSNRNR